ncbi:MAG: hypothetical protein IIC78_08695 [Chloroflexi bacterium]|nr:hypothetical protein [Chloroflexota bacterium]
MTFKCVIDCLIFLPRESTIEIEIVGGDFYARRGTRDMAIDRVGGNAYVERISGDVHTGAIWAFGEEERLPILGMLEKGTNIWLKDTKNFS